MKASLATERDNERIKMLWQEVKRDNQGLTFWQLGNIMLRLHGYTHDQVCEATGELVMKKEEWESVKEFFE